MKKKSSFSIHEAAPELLLDKIAQLSGILSKHKSKSTPSDQMQFYNELLKVMRYAYAYMVETKLLHDRNQLLEDNVRFLSQYANDLKSQLDEIHTVQRLQCEGRLEEVMELAEHYTDHVLSHKSKHNR